MKINKLLKLMLLGSLYLTASSAVLITQTASAKFSDKVIVIVNDDVITQSELDARLVEVMEEMKSQNKALPSAEIVSKKLLESMIGDRLQLQEAERIGLRVNEQEIELALQRFSAQQNKTVEQLKVVIDSSGKSFEAFRNTVRNSLTLSRLNEYYVSTKVIVPEYEIDGFIAQNDLASSDFEYHLAHILLGKSSVNKVLSTQLLSKIRSGEITFKQAAITHSDAADAEEGGVIGWRKLEQLPKIFADKVKGMEAGGVSDVLESKNGFHIFRLNQSKGSGTKINQHSVQHILINAKSLVAQKQATKRLNEIKKRISSGESFDELARIYSDDSVSAAKGGGLGWVSPGEMVESFETAYKSLKVGEISQPTASNYGMHLIKLNDVREKNITVQVARAKAENILRRKRADREFQQWVRELREQAYVKYTSAG